MISSHLIICWGKWGLIRQSILHKNNPEPSVSQVVKEGEGNGMKAISLIINKHDGIPSPMLAAWEQGWKDAVVEFYEEIKEKLL
jgi:hypothetical protein